MIGRNILQVVSAAMVNNKSTVDLLGGGVLSLLLAASLITYILYQRKKRTPTMPRRNKPIKHTPFTAESNSKTKTRYGTQQAAQKAAELRMLQVMNLELAVYQDIDGGWYLTSVKGQK